MAYALTQVRRAPMFHWFHEETDAEMIFLITCKRTVARESAFVVAFIVTVLGFANTAFAQADCGQIRAHIERLRQHISQQEASGAPRNVLNADVEIYNRWVAAYNQRCSRGGRMAGGGANGGQQTLFQLQQLLGIIAGMSAYQGGVSSGDEFAEAQTLDDANAEHEGRTMSAQPRAVTQNPFRNGQVGNDTNPFMASPPQHRLSTIPGTSVSVKLVEPAQIPSKTKDPCEHLRESKTDLTGASIGPDCLRRISRPGNTNSQPPLAEQKTPGNPFNQERKPDAGESPREIRVAATNAPIQPFGPAAKHAAKPKGEIISSADPSIRTDSKLDHAAQQESNSILSNQGEQNLIQRVSGKCPRPPARGYIEWELASLRGLNCRYIAPKSFCVSFGHERIKDYQPGVSTKADPDPLAGCTILFAS